MEREEYPTVSALFDKHLKTFEEIECSTMPTNSPETQGKVKDAIDGLVKTTVLVSELGVFSRNESMEDLPTSSIKFILVPVLIGSFTIKRTDLDRLEVLRLADIYFRDFMTRCRQYEFTDIELQRRQDSDDEEEKEAAKIVSKKAPPGPRKGMPTPEELRVMANEREEKIRRFKEKKATKDRLLELQQSLTRHSTDEDVRRKYFITLVKKFIFDSLEELESIAMERKMLVDMAALKMKGMYPDKEKEPPMKPLNPILITKDAAQKNVFGLGYPSLPSLTIEEFYDQRVKDGWFPDPCQRQSRLQAQAKEMANRPDEEEEKEKAEERDDAEKLARDRERDEWRDTHRRGWGNTYNRS